LKRSPYSTHSNYAPDGRMVVLVLRADRSGRCATDLGQRLARGDRLAATTAMPAATGLSAEAGTDAGVVDLGYASWWNSSARRAAAMRQDWRPTHREYQ